MSATELAKKLTEAKISGAENSAAFALGYLEGQRQATDVAVAGCLCGKVELKFHNSTPRYRLECCCVDCVGAFDFAVERGLKYKAGPVVHLWYFNNDITVVRGGEQLQFEMLNKGYQCKRVITKCCFSPIMVDHPFYEGGQICVYSPFVKSATYIPEIMRNNTDDLKPGVLETLPSPPNGLSFKNLTSDLENVLKAFGDILPVKPPSSNYGKTFQQLQAEHGPLVIHNFKPWNGAMPMGYVDPSACPEASTETKPPAAATDAASATE